jgi:hypothetical protein
MTMYKLTKASLSNGYAEKVIGNPQFARKLISLLSCSHNFDVKLTKKLIISMGRTHRLQSQNQP